MRKIVFMLLLAGLFVACNPEKIKIEGHIKNAKDGVVLVKMKSHNKFGERILDTLILESGDFDFYSKAIKPPVKLTFIVEDKEEFDVWLGNYGSFHIVGEQGKLKNVRVNPSSLHTEINRIHEQFYDWYIKPVQDKIDWLNAIEKERQGGKVLNNEETVQKIKFEVDVNKARKLRRLSIVKTVRKNPSSEVALALVNEEYNSLFPRHQKEMIKLLKRKFSDTALFWQLMP